MVQHLAKEAVHHRLNKCDQNETKKKCMKRDGEIKQRKQSAPLCFGILYRFELEWRFHFHFALISLANTNLSRQSTHNYIIE